MKIYLYFKVDRGYYESAWESWRTQGGSFDDHLLRAQLSIYTWKLELERRGCVVKVDLRSSFLLPQSRRAKLPLPISSLLRAGLWGTKVDPWLLQHDIIRQVKHFQPDWVFFIVGSGIWESTLRTLKQLGHRLAIWNGAPANLLLPRDVRNLPYFDLILQPANLGPELRKAGATGRIEYVPIGVNTEVHRPIVLDDEERKRYESDACFIGGLGSHAHGERRKLIEYAIENGVKMKVWGGTREQVANSPILNHWYGSIWGKEQVKAICATKIGLNFHAEVLPGELDQGLNVRAFEVPACGVFQLLQRVPSVGEFFEEGKEVVCFDSKEEMLEKIRYYLKHENERHVIAQAGQQRVLNDHTWSRRMDRIMRYL